jgi:hypothetical protein
MHQAVLAGMHVVGKYARLLILLLIQVVGLIQVVVGITGGDRMMRRRSIELACTAMLAGCAVPGQFPGGAPSARLPNAAAPSVFATQLAGPSTFLAPMPTAVVVLKPGDLNRNRAFCTAITSRLPTAQQALATSVIAPNLVLTRWLIQLPNVPVDRTSDCDFLVGTYDYARAERLLGALRLTDGRTSGPGPFLLMVIPDSTGLHVAGLDGSGYNEASFDRFVDTLGGSAETDGGAGHPRAGPAGLGAQHL